MSKTPSAAVSRVEERNESSGGSREVGDQAVWSLSSCKPGFGVDQLRDNNTETYWQSDGPQPHLVNIQFRRKTLVDQLSIYTDFKLDESYTPNRISVRVGSHFHDLQELDVVELQEPSDFVKSPKRSGYTFATNKSALTCSQHPGSKCRPWWNVFLRAHARNGSHPLNDRYVKITSKNLRMNWPPVGRN
ncbi:anaphase-promoting complex subunit 10-like isoform X2 [Varroa jacobsoni]|uniref:Anaphase-promoting complex subunit 10 n=1 Tax=Varroa destructor TaxID=109461 RepID=A0A7M7JC38_VARDE|nr:anaphase-promoting complex subunit 10-like isoform X2 [Varroa destructor]XP_022709979.1 anaphase-promoting complex subunit 10-like isoform X2 [Varroa jacobsoni]